MLKKFWLLVVLLPLVSGIETPLKVYEPEPKQYEPAALKHNIIYFGMTTQKLE